MCVIRIPESCKHHPMGLMHNDVGWTDARNYSGSVIKDSFKMALVVKDSFKITQKSKIPLRWNKLYLPFLSTGFLLDTKARFKRRIFHASNIIRI